MRINAPGGLSGTLYPLAGWPDCTTPHRGQWQGDSSFVVARGTDAEKLFTRKQLAEASVWARAHPGAQIESLSNSALCDEAVLSLYT